MNKKSLFLISLLIMSLALSGCGALSNKIPELSPENEDLIVEYATETLLKYDSKHGDKIGRKSLVAEELSPEIETEDVAEIEEPVNEDEDNSIIEDITSEVNIIDNTQDEVSSYSEIESIMGLDSIVDFTYTGYDIKNSYPDTLDAYFVMNATDNNKLLIIKFDLQNIIGDEVSVDIGSNRVNKYKIILNGESKTALTTLLDNDIRYFRKTLQPGEKEEVVLVGEYAEEELSAVDSLEVQLSDNDGNKYYVKLK